MATLKQRLHRKNASGTYDTIYFETSADMIVGSVAIENGGTGATTAANARTNLGITPANIGAAANSHNHAATDITSGTMNSARLPVVTVNKGGTGRTTLTSGYFLKGNGTSAITMSSSATVKSDLGITSLETKVEDLKTSVSEGKALIAAAVTDQGVETAATDTFQKMAENIGEIKGQLSGKTGTATILNGATGDDLSAGQKVYCRPKSSTLMNLFDISGFRPSGISTSDTICAMHAVKITDNRCIVVYTTNSYKTRIYASVLEYDSTKTPHYRRILNSSTYLSMDIEISSYRPVEVLLTFHENEYGGSDGNLFRFAFGVVPAGVPRCDLVMVEYDKSTSKITMLSEKNITNSSSFSFETLSKINSNTLCATYASSNTIGIAVIRYESGYNRFTVMRNTSYASDATSFDDFSRPIVDGNTLVLDASYGGTTYLYRFTVNFDGDDIESSTTISITATKIQYSQTVFLGHHKAFYISKSGTKILDYYALKAVDLNEKVYPDDTAMSFEFVHVKPSTLTREVTRIPYTKIFGITGMSTNNNTIESIYDVDGAGTFEITVVSGENLKESSSSSSVIGTAYCIFVIRANVIKKTIEVVQQPFWIRYYYQPAYNSILCFNDTVIDVFTRDTSSPYEIEFLSNENVTYEIIPYLEEAYYYGGYFNSPNAVVQEDTKYPNPVPIVLL